MLPKPLTILLLIVTVPVVFGCRKNKNDPAYTAKMGGVRKWHGWHSYHASSPYDSTPVSQEYALPDTSFALTIVNNSTIQMGSAQFKYQSTDAARKIFYFGKAYYYEQYGVGEGIMYFYRKDSILYCNGDRHGTHDSWTLSDTYYTY